FNPGSGPGCCGRIWWRDPKRAFVCKTEEIIIKEQQDHFSKQKEACPMFTPVDLETMVFRRGFRGYKTREVQEFMRKLIVDYEKLYKENIDLREELEKQKDLLK